MALSRSAWFVASCTALLVCSATSGMAADGKETPDNFTFSDLRLGYSGSAGPTIHQKEPSTDNWTSGDPRGWRVGLTWLNSSLPSQGYVATTYGAQVSVGSYTITKNSSTLVSLTQPTIDFYYGWQYGIFDSESLHGFGELLPFVGGGINTVDFGGETRIGPQVEGGVRAGAYLTEHNWLAGITVAYVLGQGQVKDDATDTKLDIRTNGFNFGLELGHRF